MSDTKTTYSANTTPVEVIDRLLPHKYPMELNKGDMLNLLEVLKFADENMDSSENGDVGEWAGGFRRDILGTIGLEEI